ncbi:MAG TPA: hypothetical protein HA230_03615 [Candidatus Aenigmarchaeota archaeon]|nr:hypothetical protein [Candidatus Aenigmarchaeota archaeon]
MQIKVVLNKDVAFSGYLRHVLNMERWPWIRRGPLEKVPKELTKKAIKFSGPVKLSFERHPMLDLESFNKEFKNVLDKAEKLHNEEWKKRQKELEITFTSIKDLCDKYGYFITKSIVESTGIKWPAREVWLIPSIYSGGSVVSNKIFIGFENKLKKTYLTLIIHELIHINTDSQFRKNIEGKLRLVSDSNEIATDLLADKVIEKLNNKFRLDIQPQGFHSYFAKFIKKYEKDLNKLGENKKSYESLVFAIDKFLKGKKYSGYYTKFGTKETKKQHVKR